MIDTARQRRATLSWAALAAVLFGALTVLVTQHVGFLADADHWVGRGPQRFTLEHHPARVFWTWVARAAAPVPLEVLTALTMVALFVKKHRRAAAWTGLTMLAIGVLDPLLKRVVDRPRPVWPDPVEVLHNPSFPSGHAGWTATAAGVAIVLAMMLIRRRGLRRLMIGTALLLVLLVGADRVFLGVHNASDVLAGWLLGAVIVLVMLNVFDPQPRSIAIGAEPLPEPFPSSVPTLAVILNPIKVDDPGGFKAMVEKMAAESGWARVSWWLTTAEDTGYRMAHEAAVSGADLVIAIGGDGTIRAVCEELAGTGVPVGIVPAGTGNLLARNLSIPLYLRAAVDVALNGQDRAIDMVSVSGDEMEDATYLVMAGMGMDAAIMEGVNEGFKRRVGWLAYVWSGLKAMMFPAIRVEISVDGGPFTRHRARTIVIGNVGNLQAGMPLIPDAAIDDGQLDVVLLYPRRFLSWLPIAARVLTKNKRTDETITRITGRSVVVRTPSPTPRQLDGDLIAPGRELRATCVHGRLLVRVPR